MIHNLTPNDDKVWVQWTIRFIPKNSKAARGIRTVDTRWMDVEGIQAYPVFDVLRGSGGNGRYTYPTEAQNPYAGRRQPRERVDRPRGHDGRGHGRAPASGGLYTDLYVERDGRKVHLFRSKAKYYEPAGPVSWDVSMTATRANWRVKLKAKDKCSRSRRPTTPDGRPWCRSMGIMPLAFMADEPAGGRDPFTEADKIAKTARSPTGRCPRTTTTAAGRAACPTAQAAGRSAHRAGADQPVRLSAGRPVADREGRPPAGRGSRPGARVPQPRRRRAHLPHGHELQGPCNGLTGVAFPLADDGPTAFDSGQLAMGGEPTANRVTWSTPTTLKQGTYNYFCRVHPFMRGAFRVKSS